MTYTIEDARDAVFSVNLTRDGEPGQWWQEAVKDTWSYLWNMDAAHLADMPAGWHDLIVAMSVSIYAIDPKALFASADESRHTGVFNAEIHSWSHKPALDELLQAFVTLSATTCSDCGAEPGKVHRFEGFGPHVYCARCAEIWEGRV